MRNGDGGSDTERRGTGAHAASPRRVGALAAALLLGLYAATTAPGVTFWDAGEFATAFVTLGIPHPPGTPLLVLVGGPWVRTLGVLGIPAALAAGLLAAACTAAAAGVAAWWTTRTTGSRAAGLAAALCAGTMSTVWASATEGEVYAAALLLVWATLAAAERARTLADPAGGDALVVYLLALAVPLHLSALVAAPAVALLATSAPGAPLDRRRLALLLAAAAAAGGVGSGRWWLGGAGAAGVALLAAWPAAGRVRPGRALTLLLALGLGLSPVLVLLVRARHDPGLNQGDPSTWAALAEVVARRQYAPAPPWPRQAPWWIQLGNLFEWADWQVALGLAPGAAPDWRRTPWTLAYAALALVGASWHRRRDRRGWRVVLTLLLCGSVGVAAYLNLKAGPSYGVGVLPPEAPHEARERDYFFALGFVAWGLWAGMGAVALARALARRRPRTALTIAMATLAGLALAALPGPLNLRVANRRAWPDAAAAEGLAWALLASAPPRAVLLVNGDNDSYPLWYAQAALGWRRDVVPVTRSLLPADWYRAELARRHGLLPPDAATTWRGEARTLASLDSAARAHGRPTAVSPALDLAARAAFGGREWTLRGVVVARGVDRTAAPAPHALRRALDVAAVDVAATRALLVEVERRWPGFVRATPRRGGDGTVRWALAHLQCAAGVLEAVGVTHGATRDAAAGASLEATCNVR